MGGEVITCLNNSKAPWEVAARTLAEHYAMYLDHHKWVRI